jgi:hypothetical protein
MLLDGQCRCVLNSEEEKYYGFEEFGYHFGEVKTED